LKYIYLTTLLINKLTWGRWYVNERVLDRKSSKNSGMKNSKETMFTPFSKTFQDRAQKNTVFEMFSLLQCQTVVETHKSNNITIHNPNISTVECCYFDENNDISQCIISTNTLIFRSSTRYLYQINEGGSQILETRCPVWPNSAWWLLVFVGPQYGTLLVFVGPQYETCFK